MAQESRLAIIIDSRNARQQIDELRNSLNGLQNAGGQATVGVNGLGTAARAAAGALAGIGVGRLTSGLLQMTDRFKTMSGQIALVTSSTSEAARVFEILKNTANETGSSLESTVTLFTRMSNATRGAGFSQEQLLKVTDAVNKAFIVSSATQQEAAAASIQLSQAMASGVLRGEELNSVMEQAPRITRALSEYLGVTNGQIRAMAAEGKITSEVVANALLKSLNSLNKEVATMPLLFGRAAEVMKNNFLAAIGQVNVEPAIGAMRSLGDAFASPQIITNINKLASSLSSIAGVGVQGFQSVISNIDALIAITGAYAASVGTRMVAALAASVKARYMAIAATQAQVVAERQADASAAAAAAQATRKVVTDEAAALAVSQRALAESAAARSMQANTVSQLQSVQVQLAADRALETQRLKSQITDVGRQQSLARLAEIRRTEAAITLQQAAAKSALNQTLGQEVIAQAQVTAGNARLTAAREADALATNAQNASQLRLNASQAAGARASAGLMALAGGPIGLLTTAITVAAGAALYFATSTDSATQSIIEQNLTIDEAIVKFRSLSAEQQRYEKVQWAKQQKDATEEAGAALAKYRLDGAEAFLQIGNSANSFRETFNEMVQQVRDGQRTLDSVTEWVRSSTSLTAEQTNKLAESASAYSASAVLASALGERLGKVSGATRALSKDTSDLTSAHKGTVDAQSASAQSWDKYIAQLTQTRDLIGANTAQEAAYSAAKAGFNTQQIEYSRLIGQQVDLLKKYEEAVKAGKKADQDRLSSQLLVSIKASEALRVQLEVHTGTMAKMAKATEESISRQMVAYDKLAANSVWSSMNGGKAPLQFPFVGPQGQQEKPRTGASLLTFGQEPLKINGKSPEQLLREMRAQVDGNTDAKAGKSKAESGLSSKLSAAKTAFEGLYKSAQPAKFALQEYVEKQGQLELLLSKGKITQQQYNEALAQSSINYAAAIKGAQGLAQAEQYRAQIQRRLAIEQEGYKVEAASVGMGGLQADRYRQRVTLERQMNDELIGLQDNLRLAESQSQRAAIQEQIKILEESNPARLAALNAGFALKDQEMLNATNGWTAALQNYQVSANDIAGQTQSMFSNAFQDISAGAGRAFEGMIFDGLTFGDAMAQVAEGLARGVVSALGEMAAQWAVNQALQLAFGKTQDVLATQEIARVAAETAAKTSSAAAVATAKVTADGIATASSLRSTATTKTAEVAAAGTTFSAWLPAALVKSVGTGGAAAIMGGTALLAAFALFKGFKTGGHVSGPGSGTSDSIPARLSNGEFVVNAQATKRNRALLEAINSNERVSVRGGGGGVSAQSNGSSGSGGGSSGGGGNLNIPIQVTVQAQPGMSEAEARRQGQQAGEGVRDIVRQVIQQEQRPGGMLA